MRPLLFLLALLPYFSLLAQTPARIIIDSDPEVNPWNHLEVNNQAENFQFIIVTDRTGGMRPGVFHEAVGKINLLQPEFVMSVGDLITGYTSDSAQIDREWDEFQGYISELEMPFFYVPGNHDYINDVMEHKWKERFGKDYYHFVYQDVLFLCLNTEEEKRGSRRGYVGPKQVEYTEKVLAENPDVRWTMVFMHQPLWDQEADNGQWEEIEALLAPRKHSVFVGHRHRYVKYERNNGKYFVLATTGGGSSLRGPRFGEFDHVVWVTMTDEGPIIANLMLDGIWDEDVNTKGYYDFAQPLMQPNNLQFQPYFSQEQAFREAVIEIKVQNPSDVPMLAQVNFQSNSTLWAAQDVWEDTIPPNSLEIIQLPIKTQEEGLALPNAKPIKIKADYTYLPDNQPQLMVSQSLNLQPQYLYSITKAPKKIKIDGEREEGIDLPFRLNESSVIEGDPFSHRGDKDLSASFGLYYDKSNVYLVAEVQDDDLYLDAEESPYRQDAIFFTLDPRDKAVSAFNVGREPKSTLSLGISPSENDEETGLLFRPLSLPEGTKTYCLKTQNGYRVEAAIPADWLDEQYGNDWKELRINLMISDYDQEGQYISRMYWTPDWRSADRLLGSGTFQRE
ncbi:MAG: metallophosphoesterase [Bacteroidota bacterium]